jgi:hypothetical protein
MIKTREEATHFAECLKRNSTINFADMEVFCDMAIKVLEQEPVLDKVRNEIAECGSIWVAYAITGHSDRDIENLIEGVLKQAKEQVLNIIDKYRTESEEEK